MVWSDQRLRLVLKSVIFGGFLLLVELGNTGVFPVLFFLAVSALLYFKTSAYSKESRNIYSFLVLLAVSLGSISILDHWEFILPAVLLFSFLFYLVLGIKELIFVYRYQWYFINNLFLFYAIFILFFLTDKSSLFLLKYAAVFIMVFSLFRERFFLSSHYFPKRHLLTAMLCSFVAMELLWATAILPLGFVNSANLMILIVYVLIDFINHHFQGTLNKKMILRNLTIFIIALLIILGTSVWKAG